MPMRFVKPLFQVAPPSEVGVANIDVRLAESDHRIANSLALVAGLLRLQASDLQQAVDQISAKRLTDPLLEAAGRIEIVGRMHRRMAHLAAGDSFDLAELLREVADATVASLAPAGRTRLLLGLDGACLAPSRLALPVSLAVGELVTNSIKHAHPTGVEGEIEVSCSSGEGGDFVVEVSDDGVGLPDDFDPQTSTTLGFRLLRALCDQMHGVLSFSQSPIGFAVRLSAPMVIH
jgi:two-component sensor histidine kinase